MIKKIIIGVISAIALIFISLIIFYNINLSSVNGDKAITFIINSGEASNNIIKRLKEEDLIKNEFIVKLYCKLNGKTNFQAGTYELTQKMDVDTIVTKFNIGDVVKDTFNLTLVEGKRLIDYVEIISSTLAFNNNDNEKMTDIVKNQEKPFNKVISDYNSLEEIINKYILGIDISEEEKNNINLELNNVKESYNKYKNELTNLLKDETYLNELINKYWFIDESILDSKIYYPLEGYLYPDTYEFKKNVTTKEVINKLIATLDNKISKYKEDIEKSKYSFHELLTLSSMIEAEAATPDDRKLVSGVFYNRLNDGWTLGSDVTTYYAARKKFTDEITIYDLNDCNAYNTRSTCLVGLPIGPINSPSYTAIYAAIYPTANDYYYFVADKNKKVYFSKTYEEQGKVISDLVAQGLWL